MKWLNWLNHHFEEILSVIFFTLMTIFIFLQIIFRELANFALDWTEELGRYTFIWLVYISASLAVKYNRHLRIEFIETILPDKISKWYALSAQFVWLLFSLLMVKEGFFVAKHILLSGQTSPSVGLTMGWVYMIIPAGFTLMSIRILQLMIQKLKTAER